MKKLFKAGFAVLAIALLTSSALAFSPVWDAVPDVLVGDSDLVFTDAIDIFGYVSDEDNATTSLKIVFAEGPWDTNVARSAQETDGATSTEIAINGKDEVDYSGPGDVPLANNDLMGDSAKYITTPADGNLTFSALSDSQDRAVVYIASDGITSPTVSKVFRVRTDSADTDSISFTIVALDIAAYSTNAEFAVPTKWNFTSLFTPTSGSGSDALSITSTVAANNDFAWWQLASSATDIPLVADSIMRGRFDIQANTAPADWVAIQARMFQANNAENAKLNVSANGYVPAANTPRTYELFYQPTGGGVATSVLTGFYLIDTDATRGGTYTLNSVDIDAIVGLDDLFVTDLTVDSGGDLDFTAVEDLNFSNLITFTQNADAFTWTASSAATVAAAIGQLNSGTNFAADKLYRVVNTVSSSVNAYTMPTFKLRLFDANNQIVSERELLGQGIGNSGHMPDAGGKDLAVYLASDGVDGTELRFSFDFINNDTNKSGAITWDKAVVQSVDVNAIP